MTLLSDQLSIPMLADHEVLPAVRSVRAVVESGAADAKEARTLPRPTVDALAATGLFALRAPRAVGGSEVDPLTALTAYEEMAPTTRRLAGRWPSPAEARRCWEHG